MVLWRLFLLELFSRLKRKKHTPEIANLASIQVLLTHRVPFTISNHFRNIAVGDFIKKKKKMNFSLLGKLSDLTTQSSHLTRTLFCPWDSPGKNTGVDTHSLLQVIFPMLGSNSGPLHCRQILSHLSHQGAVGLNSKQASNPLDICWNTDLRSLLSEVWFGKTWLGPEYLHLPGFQDWGSCSRDHILKAMN